MLAQIRLARAQARDRAWTARSELTGTELPGSRAAGKTITEMVIDLDATLVTAHSDKQDVRGDFKGGFGQQPLGPWLDNTGQALAWCCDRATPAATPPQITAASWSRR
jgi:hypothetical protein